MSALGAELLRTRRSPAARLTLVGVVICLLSVVGQLLVSTQRSWAALLMWHVPHVTGFAAVLTGLLVALVERRERGARAGGAQWRATPPSAQRSARLLVLAGLSLVTNLLVFVPFAPAGLLLGLFDPPVGRLFAAALLVWAGGACWLVIGVALARRTGPWPVVGLGVIWQVVGTVLAESGLWWALPPTWSVRPVLPLLGTHFNGVPLEPRSPVWDSPTVGPLAASLALAVLVLPAAVAGSGAERGSRLPLDGKLRKLATVTGPPWISGGRSSPMSTVADSADQAGAWTDSSRIHGGRRTRWRASESTWAALVSALRRTAIAPLVVATVILLAVVTLVYPPSYLVALFGLAVLPAGAAVLAVVAWQAHEPAWRIVITRGVRPEGVPLRLLAVLCALVTAVAVLTGVLLAADGHPALDAVARVIVAAPLGCAVVALTLWMHARMHVAVALVVAFFSTAGGILFGGSVLATTPLWLAGPAGWTYSATTPGRIAVAVAVSVLVAVVAGSGFIRAAVRA